MRKIEKGGRQYGGGDGSHGMVRGSSFDVVVMWCEEGLMAMGLTAAGSYQSEKKKMKGGRQLVWNRETETPICG